MLRSVGDPPLASPKCEELHRWGQRAQSSALRSSLLRQARHLLELQDQAQGDHGIIDVAAAGRM